MNLIATAEAPDHVESHVMGHRPTVTYISGTRGCCGHEQLSDRLKRLPADAHVLFRFRHGLGDAVQFTCVLQQVRQFFPDWTVDVATLRGKESALSGWCRRAFHDQEPQPSQEGYQAVFDVNWDEARQVHPGLPASKVTQFLVHEFGIQPDPELYHYRIEISAAAREAARAYLESVVGDRAIRPPQAPPTTGGENGGTPHEHQGAKVEGPQQGGKGTEKRFPVVLLHYEGNTSAGEKNLSHEMAAAICHTVHSVGLVPVILDWDRRSPVPDGKTIFCPDADNPLWNHTGTGDAEILAALIEQSALMIGVDSGPLHVAGATSTPTIGVWTRHFPAQYFDLADNVTHLIPENWRELEFARQSDAAEYFLRSYRHQVYRNTGQDRKNPSLMGALVHAIVAAAEAAGTGMRAGSDNLMRLGDFWIRCDNIEQDLVIVRDIYEEDAYRTRLLSDNGGPHEVVFDIGAHIGTFARLWHQKNAAARIVCVEACPENLEALRANVGEFATVVHAACTYEPGPAMLLNAVRPDCESTGGSVVVPASETETTPLRQEGYKYWEDRRELPKVTLEELMAQAGVGHINILKLDCEGSEYSILGKTPSLEKIRIIVGEYTIGRDGSRSGRSGWPAGTTGTCMMGANREDCFIMRTCIGTELPASRLALAGG